ncbi:MAG: hypothetical protein LBE86_10190 [Gemmobacter sp.]|jgi:hypothetical protein|nr:hypothetical protein [Gemmobacter sp.]
MSTLKQDRKAAFKLLDQSFREEIIPILEDVEFQPTMFSTHRFGMDGHLEYNFVSLQNSLTLDLLRFVFDDVGLSILAYDNRIRLSRNIYDLSFFEGKEGLEFHLMPFVSTEKDIHRWVPIPFLWIPRLYKVKGDISEGAVQKSVDKVIADLGGDLKYFEIIRSEWDREHKPLVLDVDTLT